jgi:hypothetical protein
MKGTLTVVMLGLIIVVEVIVAAIVALAGVAMLAAWLI